MKQLLMFTCFALAGALTGKLLTTIFTPAKEVKILRIAVVDTGYNKTKDYQGLTFCNGKRTGPYENDDVLGHGTNITNLIFNSVKGKKTKTCFIMEHIAGGGPISTATTITDAINRAIDQNPDVMNLSLTEEQYTVAMYKAIKRANDAGIVVFTAAGNHSLNFNVACNKYPACFRGFTNLHTVGAYYEKNRGLPTSYSNFGLPVTLWYSGTGPGGAMGTSFSTARATADWVNNYVPPTVEPKTFFRNWNEK